MSDDLSGVFTIKRGDTQPLLATLLLPNKKKADLGPGTTAKIIMRPKITGVGQNVNAAVDILQVGSGTTATDKGRIEWTPQEADVARAGTHDAEVEVTYASGQKQTFPTVGYLTVVVQADLG